jgi:hypothetical protein
MINESGLDAGCVVGVMGQNTVTILIHNNTNQASTKQKKYTLEGKRIYCTIKHVNKPT